MINTHELELPLSRTYFHDSKGVRAINVLLYSVPHLRLHLFFLGTRFVPSANYEEVQIYSLHQSHIGLKLLTASFFSRLETNVTGSQFLKEEGRGRERRRGGGGRGGGRGLACDIKVKVSHRLITAGAVGVGPTVSLAHHI